MGIFDTFKRFRLVQKGMSTGAKRKTHQEGVVSSAVNKSPLTRAGLYLIFTIFITLLSLYNINSGPFANSQLKTSLFAFILTLTAISSFEIWTNHAPKSRDVLLVFGGLALHLLLIELVMLLPEVEVLTMQFKLIAIPYILVPMVTSILLGKSIGLFTVVMNAIFGMLALPADYLMDYVALSIPSGIVTVYLTLNVRKRISLLRAGFYTGLSLLVIAILLQYINFSHFGTIDEINWQHIALKISCSLILSILISMIVGGVLPILENTFAITTSISWLELSDLNHKLLKKMQLEAPGTFHHSLVMASLAEAAAEAVGANATMCRVCAYFHDIGKLKKPEYFIENQGGNNPHDNLTPTMSAIIIIAHVKDGIDLAIKHKLNKKIIDVIQEHHGDSLVYYFYRKAKEKAEAEALEKNQNDTKDIEIDEKSFRYPGPTPSSRESAILSIADAIESASRTMEKPTHQKIKTLVDDIVKNRINDGQLDRCQLSLADLATVKKSFCKTLRNMLHNRIEYPKENTEQ